MLDLLEPLKTDNLKDIFVKKFENLILSGKIKIGEKLPSERDLAAELEISRPVVHEGLMDLAAKGLVSMKSRSVSMVNDYRKNGSLAILTSLVTYNKGRLDPQLLAGILELRMMFETQFARLAAERRTAENVHDLRKVIVAEQSINETDILDIVRLDFEFHSLVALSTGNMIFSLLLNSFKPLYTNITGEFFKNRILVNEVLMFHQDLFHAIEQQKADDAEVVMRKLLAHGEQHLVALFHENRTEHHE